MDLHTKFRYICIMTGKCKCRLPKKQNGRFWEKRGKNQGLWGKITGAKRKLQFVWIFLLPFVQKYGRVIVIKGSSLCGKPHRQRSSSRCYHPGATKRTFSWKARLLLHNERIRCNKSLFYLHGTQRKGNFYGQTMEIIAGRTPAGTEQLHERADSGRSKETAGTVRL